MDALTRISDVARRYEGDFAPAAITRSPRPGCPAGPEPGRSDRAEAAPAQSAEEEEFLVRFGDVIDDRVAEALDEILDERDALRPRWRLRPGLAALALLLAVVATVLLRHSGLAVGAVWLSTAAVCLAAARTARAARP